MIVVTHNHSTLPVEESATSTAVLRWQEEAGCDVVTDGFFFHRDPVWLAIELTSGAEPGALRDYWGSGFLVPTPVVRDHLHHQRNAAVEHWRAVQEHSGKPVKVVLPGPLTLAALSEDRGVYSSESALCEAWATLLLGEIAALVDAGVQWIQLDEPAILERPEQIRFLRELLEPIWDGRGQARLVVSTWGPGASILYAQLHSLPADVVGVDLVSEPGLLGLIGSVGASQELYLGVLRPDAELGVAAELGPSLAYALKRYELPRVHLGPACGLAGMTPEKARQALSELRPLALALADANR